MELMRNRFLTLAILISVNTLAQPQFIALDNAEVKVDVIGLDNRREKQPVIVFENGHGETIQSWNKIVDSISKVCPVVLYDRAGTGESEPDHEDPSIEYNSKKLKRILETLGIQPPYILVGHSLGGIYIRGFANYYADDLAGLIFVDPADFTQKLSDFEVPFREIGVTEKFIDSMMIAKFGNAITIDSSRNIRVQHERELLRTLRTSDFQELKEKDLPPIPIHFIIGGRFSVPPQFRSKDFDQEALFRARTNHWIENWTNVVNKSPYGKLFYSSKAGHYVQYDDPELVIESIKLAVNDYYKMITKNN